MNTNAFLEHFSSTGQHDFPRIMLDPFPFRIGRGRDCNYVLASSQISKAHVEFLVQDDAYHIRDLNSTNGTFVNGKPIKEGILRPDDIIHLASEEFRFLCESTVTPFSADGSLTNRLPNKEFSSLGRNRKHLKEIVASRLGRTVFQPIVCLDSGSIIGYESLARGSHEHLKLPPGELFAVSEQCGMALPLSEMFRQLAIEEAASLPTKCPVFLNVHPFELTSEGLSPSLLEMLSGVSPDRQIVLEMNERAILRLAVLAKVKSQLRRLGVKTAYDDFGAGQSRLLELSECPPDYVKLDMALVRNIHLAPSRLKLVKAVISTCKELEVTTIAEGIECREEAEIFRSLGCDCGQGYFFGRPEPAPSISSRQASSMDATIDGKLL